MAKCKGRISGPIAVADIAVSIRKLANSFSGSAGGPSAPEHHVKAIFSAEKDKDLSDDEKLKLICLFHEDISAADTYLAIEKKSTHTAFVCANII